MADVQIGDTTDLFKLFVGQIPKEMDELSLRQYFEEFGPIVEVSIIRDNATMLSKGCAFVTYSYEHSAQMAMDKLHDKVQLPNSMNSLQVRFAETQVDRDNKLFIGMLPKTLGEQDLHDLFSMYGELREVHVIRGPEGGAKGCAFVKFVEREAAVAAIENLNDTIPAGATRPLVVKFADGKKPAGKEDPWQGQQIPQSYRPMGGGQPPHMQQQQRMLYPPYGSSPSIVAGMHGGQQQPQLGGAPYHQPALQHQSPPGMQQRYMYMQQSPTGPQGQAGGGGYYPHAGQQLPPAGPQQGPGDLAGGLSGSGDGTVSPMYGSQHSPHDLMAGGTGGLGSRVPSQDTGDYGSGASAPGGLEVLPPPQIPQQQQYPLDSESSHVRPPEGPSGANLFIYHLPRDLTDADLATLFAPFGNVISAKVFVDKKTSDSKGFGFVSYDTLENANSAIESMNGFQIGSKRLKVQHKRVMGSNPPPGQQHGGYGAPHMHQHQHHQHMGGGHGQHSLYQQPQQSYYRPSPAMGGGSTGGMMGAPMLSQQQAYGGGGMGGVQSQHQQQMGGMGQYGMRPSSLGAGGRGGMQQQQPMGQHQQGGGGMGSAGRGGGGGNYGYSYPTLSPYGVPAQQQQQQRGAPGMSPAPQQQQVLGAPRMDLYGGSSPQHAHLQQQQHPGAVSGGGLPYPPSDQHAAAQSTHGGMSSYMDASNSSGSGSGKHQQSSNTGGFYGQY